MRSLLFGLTVLLFGVAQPALAADKPTAKTYSKGEVMREVEAFFGEGAEGLSDIVTKAFDDYGEPNAFIAGNEASAALGIGVRYGEGQLKTKSGVSRKVYWQGPSIGFDVGANASKVFVLIYHLPSVNALFARYPGVEGSLYFIGGVGMNYLKSGKTVIAPIRFGAGWRQGVNAGYMHFTRKESMIPL